MADRQHSALVGLDKEIEQLNMRIAQELTDHYHAKRKLKESKNELRNLYSLREQMEMTIEEAEGIVINLINDSRRRAERLNSCRKRAATKTIYVKDFPLRTQALVEAFGTPMRPYSCKSEISVEYEKTNGDWVRGYTFSPKENLALKRVGIAWETFTTQPAQATGNHDEMSTGDGEIERINQE
ncbi:hypothetical protein QKT49_gp159 [Acanthamoeba castellanii medusavirus]|uniref:Uncharacterized protein n=1 Tax=Acanthamoeba castellanii medusavirus J1 TaxID=3114988 RepID=A0A3T1CWV9_9VIRU|nr:hypothetical protein QKT49_gp159 [Acanthamoeba castellanii medusavirus]BBI30299.1 hypothetical protein [Acanthamoeba castellanii medusavirus J1]